MQKFVKIDGQRMLSSWMMNYPDVRFMFEDLLKLVESDGIVHMDYPAIARWTQRAIAVVVQLMSELAKRRPESRDQAAEGRSIRPICGPDGRPIGWEIVNYKKFRKGKDENARQETRNRCMRNLRARRKAEKLADQNSEHSEHSEQSGVTNRHKRYQVSSGEHSEQTPAETPSKPSEHSEPRVSSGEHSEPNRDRIEYIPPTIPHSGGFTALDFEQATSFLNAVFRREKRKWSYEETQLLNDLVPISAADARRIHVWFTLPDEHPVWQRTRRKQELTTFLRDYNGELDKIAKFAAEIGLARRTQAPAAKKQEPARWREFLQWKYDKDVRLPASFWDLPEDLQRKYRAGFTEFEKEKAA